MGRKEGYVVGGGEGGGGGGWWAAINLNLASVAGSRWIIVTFQDLILDRYEPEKRS